MSAVTLVGAAHVTILLGGVVGALTVLVKAPPLRWLARTLVKEPGAAWLRGVVREVLHEHPLTNGWGVAAVTKIAEQVGADVPDPHHHETGDG